MLPPEVWIAAGAWRFSEHGARMERVIAKFPFMSPTCPDSRTTHSPTADHRRTGRRRAQRILDDDYLTPIECMSNGNF
jgi:hypothetical protein